MRKHHTLQRLIWPNINLNSEVELYGITNDLAQISLKKNTVKFVKNGWLLTDTFFNSISVGVWKKYTIIDNLSFLIEGQGRFLVRFGLHHLGNTHKWLDEIEIDLKKSEIIPINSWNSLTDGMLYCKIIALSDGEITGGSFITTTPPRNEIKLGIVITHYNRKSYVLPAIERIQQELASNEYFKNRIDLVVVDNSQNISNEENHNAIIIPNINLGGSGGFARGILYLIDHSYTHCLLMDDDASCEIESIRRAYTILSYGKNERIAVAGSLLREIEPYRLFEKGANFDGFCRPLKSGLDMRHVLDLLIAETPTKKTDYGGWWFFAFKLASINHFPFPFFVRGDDIQFGLLNKFDICTMNGIACWGEDFGLKHNPLTTYLDTRNHILNTTVALKEKGVIDIIIIYSKLFSRALFSYNYASARAATLAVKHFIQGPDFWVENINMSAIRKTINDFTPSEKLDRIYLHKLEIEHPKLNEGKARKLIRILTLNGFLIPSIFLKNKIVIQDKSFKGWFRGIFRFKKVLYYYEPLSLGYIAEHNKKAFFIELIGFFAQTILLLIKFKELRKSYNSQIQHLTSEKFWREIYRNENAGISPSTKTKCNI